MDLFPVAGTVVVADDGGAADGIADEHRHEQEGRIHDDAVGRHAVFARKAEQLIVIEDVDQRHREVGHQLGRAVDTGVPQDMAVELGLAEVQPTRVVPVHKIKHRQQTADDLADKGRNGRTLDTPVERADQNDVQHHIGAARAHRKGKAEVRLFGGNEKALEHILQNKGGQRDQQDAAIPQRIVQHLPLCAQQRSHRLNDEQTDDREDDARNEGRDQEQAEKFIGLLVVALAQRDTYNGRAAGTQHEADGADQHRQRHDEVDRSKSRFAHKVRDAQAVHDAVDRGEQHGTDAGQHKPDQPGIGKVVGQLNGFLWHNFSFFLRSTHAKRPDKNHRSSAFPFLLRHYGAHSLREARAVTSYPAFQLR